MAENLLNVQISSGRSESLIHLTKKLSSVSLACLFAHLAPQTNSLRLVLAFSINVTRQSSWRALLELSLVFGRWDRITSGLDSLYGLLVFADRVCLGIVCWKSTAPRLENPECFERAGHGFSRTNNRAAAERGVAGRFD